jgi:hypothetical protein
MFNEESPTYRNLQKVKKPVGGRGQFIMPIQTKNAGTFKGVVEGGTIPTSVAPGTAEALFSLQEYVGVYDVTWKLLADARNDKFAFQTAVQFLDDSLKRRILRLLNVDLIDNGKGRLGVLPAADNDTTVTLNGLPRMEVGMVVDVMDLSDDDTKLEDSATVTAVDPIARTVTLSGAPGGTAAGDYIVLEDTCDDSISDSLHSHGLLGVINNADPAAVVGDYGGIDRGTAGTEYYESVVLDAAGILRPLTEDLLLQAMDGAREKGGVQLDRWLSNLNIIRRYYVDILQPERFFALAKPGTLSGGVGRPNYAAGEDGKTPFSFSGIDWDVDPFFEANTIIGMDSSHFFLGVGETDEPRPISDIPGHEDQPFFKSTSSTTYEVVWYFQMELLSDNPAAGVRINDIAES